jgi:hypothetical protein
MSIKDVIEIISNSPIWGRLSLPEREDAVINIIKNLRSHNVTVEEDVDVADFIGEVYGG